MTDDMTDIAQLARKVSVFGEAELGQLFGESCLKMGGKAFAAYHAGSFVFKLPDEQRSKTLQRAKANLWDPSGKGRPMKEWVVVPEAEMSGLIELSRVAMDFVAGTAATGDDRSKSRSPRSKKGL